MDCRERVERTRPAATLCVSACLLGCACRYDGKSVPDPQIIALGTYFHLVPLCPEQMGGLPTPRTPSEYNGTAVMMQNGTCVTDAFFRGAREALRLIRLHGAIGVILKDKSPSCGVGTRYDGTLDFIDRYKDDGIIWYFDIFAMKAEAVHNTLFKMKDMGYFENARGFVFGRVMFPSSFSGMSYIDAAKKILGDAPMIFDADVGHVPPKMTLINGAMARVESSDGKGSVEMFLE